MSTLTRLRRRAARSRTRPGFIVAALAVGVAGLVAAALLGGGKDGDSLVLDDAVLAPEVPSVRPAAARDPGGDAFSRVTLPPRRRWFGFSGNYFVWTGNDPVLDHGITAERTAADAVAAGANSARIDVHWFSLFPEPGRINREYVATVDAFVDELEGRGGRVLIYLGGTPPWASTRPGDRHAAPRTDSKTLREFSRYVTFVARHWPDAVGIETWNEPNGVFTWGPRPDPRAFLRLHRTAARAIRRVDPDMPVILGGIAGQLSNPLYVTPQRYMKHLYSAGLRPSDYDGLAFHPYPSQGEPQRLDSGWFASVFRDFRSGYAWRDRKAALWITETGASTTGDAPFEQKEQARVVVALVRKLLTMPRVKGVYLHTQYDFLDAPSSSVERGFGLLRSRGAAQGRPKQAFCALRALVRNPPPFEGCRRPRS